MTSRETAIDAFLAATDWANAPRQHLSGDASTRSYIRLKPTASTPAAILMNADPAQGNTTAPFIEITGHLRSAGLSAPQIFESDTEQGFLLLEDLGDDLFARLLASDPSREIPLYTAAADVLLHLHTLPAPAAVPMMAPATMGEMIRPCFEWYATAATGTCPTQSEDIIRQLTDQLDHHLGAPSVLILRDYHAENLLWLPDRTDLKRVGLLDYQDALLGHPAYDLASLLKDARRDVSAATEASVIEHVIARSDVDPLEFRRAYHLIAVQRNLRILGIFARLCIDAGKPGYIDLIPRVWRHIIRDLDTAACAPLATLILSALPEPTPALLTRVKNQCAKPPTP